MFLPYFCTPKEKPCYGNFLRKTSFELVAQLVEQYTFNVWVLGSSPSQFTKPHRNVRLFLCPYSLKLTINSTFSVLYFYL